ncbi:MAG: transglycosylase SLT domain-containing protein [Oligoflexia bacterium]|nr:transglycosylase SLT domain-containing protein [Oligoflexia bacterium]
MILALIFVESSFRVDAVSHKGALGLMQLMPVTAQETFDLLPYDWSGEEALFNPILNLELALAHLRELRVKMGNQTSHYLSAYNMGYAGMKRRLLVEGDYIAPYGLKVIQQTKKMKAQKKRINGGI